MTYIDKNNFEFISSEDNEFRKHDLIGIMETIVRFLMN